MRRCEVYLHGIKAGMLTEEDNGEYTFTYDSSYLEKRGLSIGQLDSSIT